MFKFSRNFEYALIALKHIASKKGKKISTAREISTQYSLSFNLMARIMVVLKNGNIVTSIQGTNGGYTLNKCVNKLSILDLMQIISGQPLFLTSCLANNEGEKKKCKTKPEKCNIFDSVKDIQKKIYNVINEISLNEVFESD